MVELVTHQPGLISGLLTGPVFTTLKTSVQRERLRRRKYHVPEAPIWTKSLWLGIQYVGSLTIEPKAIAGCSKLMWT